MSESHARFEELAVGHVLGGLAQDDATEFRTHLTTCRDCRLRVAELRGIAADLEAAERQERQLAQIKTEVARREDPDEPVDDRGWPWAMPSHRTIALLSVALAVSILGMATWTMHLRTVNDALRAATQRQELVMEAFASGTTVATTFASPVAGRVAITGELVAFTLSGVPAIASDRRLVIWLVSGDDAAPVFIGLHQDPDGRVAWAGLRAEADRLLVTIETWPPDDGGPSPEGTVLVEADLTAPQVEHVPDGITPRAPLRSS